MKRTARLLFGILCLSALGISTAADACSNILVTRGASSDGSNMVSYTADSHELYGNLRYRPAGNWEEGSMLKVFDWDSGRYLTDIPQPTHTWQTVGNMNEKQLIITETTYGGRPELWDSTGRMDYGSMIYIALQRASTAREAIEVMTGLACTHGYYSEGESFSIADKDEVWILEVIGKGFKDDGRGGNARKGVVWVARRVPDGFICAHANQARISTFPLNDPENCLYSKDVVDFAREMGWFSGKDADFSFCDTYAPLDFSGMRACEARAWSAFNILCDGKFTYVDETGAEVTRDAYDYIEYALGHDRSKRFPLFVKPSRKLGVKDVADAMRDHFEGTPMDMTQDIGAGGNALPYRWRPMSFTSGGNSYCNERAIATQQTGFWLVGQSRKELPDAVGGLLWFGTDDSATSYLTPIYTCTSEVPECFREGNGDLLTYSPTSAFWMCNRVANACYKMYNHMSAEVRKKIDEWENAKIAEVKEIDAEAMRLYREASETPVKMLRRGRGELKKVYDPFAQVRSFLTGYTVDTAQDIFEQWVELETLLLVKYMDGNVKGQNPDGSFKTSPYSDAIPGEILHPDYTGRWKDAVAADKGEVLMMVEPK